MKLDRTALPQRVQTSFQRLSSTAANLNSVSDSLNSSIADLEGILKKLGLGITSWEPFKESRSADGFRYWIEEIGYAKVNGKWGLAIRARAGNDLQPDDEDIDFWPFNEAPRHLRVLAVNRIPELVERLDKDAAEIANKVVEQIESVNLLTSAFSEVTHAKTEVKTK